MDSPKGLYLSHALKLNIEANHAILASHSFEHDLTVASADGKLDSIDANRGDCLLGWDTAQRPRRGAREHPQPVHPLTDITT